MPQHILKAGHCLAHCGNTLAATGSAPAVLSASPHSQLFSTRTNRWFVSAAGERRGFLGLGERFSRHIRMRWFLFLEGLRTPEYGECSETAPVGTWAFKAIFRKECASDVEREVGLGAQRPEHSFPVCLVHRGHRGGLGRTLAYLLALPLQLMLCVNPVSIKAVPHEANEKMRLLNQFLNQKCAHWWAARYTWLTASCIFHVHNPGMGDLGKVRTAGSVKWRQPCIAVKDQAVCGGRLTMHTHTRQHPARHYLLHHRCRSHCLSGERQHHCRSRQCQPVQLATITGKQMYINCVGPRPTHRHIH